MIQSRTITRPAKAGVLSRIILPASLIPVRHPTQYSETAYSSLTIATLRAIEQGWSEFPVSIVEDIEEHREYWAGTPKVSK